MSPDDSDVWKAAKTGSAVIKIEAFQLGLRRQHTIEKVRMEAVITAGAQTMARGG